ncbi:sigma-54-dependent transcriptional regulator [Gabonibacter chumensis]|uniref:sigma-54-dependent transcriptional regulator n=1 Tax=Gabonibacter chumensis TaxID=2972474 RepID=UPI002572C588|nr:sigma-54 dependent transcriptional regulator [Gabonibacter chumensis]MCR9012807.1 sigma-54 dependent transcriptional regulator [Gabonibacter chumensis]
MNKVLIIDDENQLRGLLSRIIGLEGYEVFQADSCTAGLKQAKQCMPDVVLCDVRLPDGNGVEIIERLKQLSPRAEIIMLTAHGNIPDGVQAIKNGAFDYITKGDDNNRIIPLISRAMEKVARDVDEKTENRGGEGRYTFDTILGRSEVMQEAIRLARKVAVTDVPVLLTGETGTGKEVFAQAIHQGSNRNKKSFVAVNCSAFSKELLESEMFGHKAGAFTGALKDKKGLFEEAHQGTLFLDEIGEMAFDLQAKLLRILESGEFIKIGDTKPTKVDVRVIAATNRDLSKEIAAGHFREDLFYRLSVFQIHLPPLRERTRDIEVYVHAFVNQFSTKMRKKITFIQPDYMALLKQHAWNGNVRELRNVVERSIVIADGEQLSSGDLPIDLQHGNFGPGEDRRFSEFELANIEKNHIQKVLQYTGGNKTEAARLMHIGLTTLYRKIEEYGLGEK